MFLNLYREVFDFDGCRPGEIVGKRGVFKSGLMPISSLDNSTADVPNPLSFGIRHLLTASQMMS